MITKDLVDLIDTLIMSGYAENFMFQGIDETTTEDELGLSFSVAPLEWEPGRYVWIWVEKDGLSPIDLEKLLQNLGVYKNAYLASDTYRKHYFIKVCD